MKKIVLFLFLTSIFSCTLRHDFDRADIEQIEDAIEKSPDSTYIVLSKLSKEERFDDDLRLKILTIRAKNKSSIDLDEQDANVLKEIIPSVGNDIEKLEILYLLGSAYRDMHDFPQSAKYFEEAKYFGESHTFDTELVMKSVGQLADIYQRMCLYDLAIKANVDAGNYARQRKDTFYLSTTYDALAGIYYLQGKYSDAIKTCKLNHKLICNSSYKDYEFTTFGPMLGAYQKLGRWDKVREILEQTFNSGIIGDTSLQNKKDEVTLGIYADLLLHDGEIEKAKEVYNYCLSQHPNNLDVQINAYKGFRDLYKKQGMTDSCLFYLQKLHELAIDIYQENVTNSVAQIQAAYDYSRHETVALKAEQEAKQTKYIAMMWGGLSVVSIIFLMLSLLIMRQRHRVLYSQTMEIKLKLEKDVLMLQQQLEQNTAKHLEESDSQSLNTQKGLIEIKKYIAKLLPDNHLHNEDFKKIVELAEKYYPHLIHYLYSQNIHISEQELVICILMRSEVRPNEIATLITRQQSCVNNSLTRLCTKVTGTPAKIHDARQWLENIPL